ncbi:MAG: phosphohistidine phosphatase SixA [Alkalibacterium sp.]|nr:phosphohistidine phosphatase SixA [Alkalibacterium sp.]
MAIELMLVRHGKAEERSADKEDAKRQLTEEGKDEFAAFISSVNKDLKTDLNIRVWTSPMKRAKQTAEILTEQLNWPKAEEKDFLASGDYQAFTEEVKALDSDTRVVCVGHKPTQGDWVGVLTGSPYSFKKGGVALIHLGDDRIQGKLVWDNDPKSKKKTDKRVKPIKAVLLNQVDEMEQAYLDFQNNPYAPERTHEFRKTMRKLRSQLHFIKPLIGKEAYKDLNAVIKDAYHRVEPIREADVLITSCGTCALQEPDLIDDFADLFRYLHKERRKWMRISPDSKHDCRV